MGAQIKLWRSRVEGNSRGFIREHTRESLLKKLEEYKGRRLPNTHNVKLLLIKHKLLEERCVKCGLGSFWRGKSLSLHLDHMDGDARNNCLDNLRLLCPNCHSQTATYCGKNSKRYGKAFCKDCNKELSSSWSLRCMRCSNILKSSLRHKVNSVPTKIRWPTDENLVTLLQEYPTMEAVAHDLGVSSNAVRKRCRRRDIDFQLLINSTK